MTGHCKDCIYFEKDAYEDDFGLPRNECHRYPRNSMCNGYPEVEETDWCGEYKSKIWVDGNGFPIKSPPKPRDVPPDTKTDNERWG